jgi:hypothetical protein
VVECVHGEGWGGGGNGNAAGWVGRDALGVGWSGALRSRLTQRTLHIYTLLAAIGCLCCWWGGSLQGPQSPHVLLRASATGRVPVPAYADCGLHGLGPRPPRTRSTSCYADCTALCHLGFRQPCATSAPMRRRPGAAPFERPRLRPPLPLRRRCGLFRPWRRRYLAAAWASIALNLGARKGKGCPYQP